MSTVVALDIGSSAIAGVELKVGRDRVSLSKASVEPISAGLVHDGEILQPDELSDELKRFWKHAKFSGKKVRLGVANQRVVVRVIDLPVMDDDADRAAAVEFEAGEHIPIPPDQSVVDFQPIMRYQGEEGERERLVVVAAHREMVDQLVSVVKRAGLQPVGIDLEAFALLRALQAPPMVLDEGSVDTPAQAVVHVGAEVTHVIVSVDRNCHFTRMIGFGGEQLTRSIEERVKLPHDEAEAMKVACGLLGPGIQGWDKSTVDEVRHALALGARPLVREVARSLDYYRSQPFSRGIQRITLSGGSSLCTGLDRYLQQGVGIKVDVGDPLGQLDAGDVPSELSARIAVAVGLSLDTPGGVS